MHSILVIEDDHDIRVALRSVLENAGYFVFSAANGENGFATLSRIKPPSLILLDWNMPILNGESFLAEKMKDKSVAHVPTVIISRGTNGVVPNGAVEVLRDPLNFGDLFDVVKKYCAN